MLGGGSSFEVQPLETLPAFDLETGTWNSVRTHPDASIPIEESYVEQYPRPRRCHSIEKCGHSKKKTIVNVTADVNSHYFRCLSLRGLRRRQNLLLDMAVGPLLHDLEVLATRHAKTRVLPFVNYNRGGRFVVVVVQIG